MAIRRKQQVPEIVSGYEVFEGLISFVRPSTRATNLIKNPRMWDTSNYTAINSTEISYTHSEQYRGLFSLYCSASAGSYNAIAYEINLTGNQKYKFSVDFKAKANETVSLYVSSIPVGEPVLAEDEEEIVTEDEEEFSVEVGWDTSLVLHTKSFISTGDWQRLNFEFTPSTTDDYYVMVVAESDVDFYTDGWLLVKSDDMSGENETYFDGDTLSYTLLDDYFWSGERNESPSVRLRGSGASGREVFLSDLGFRVRGVAGLGMNPVSNIAVPINTGGGYYQNTIPNIRSISVVGSIIEQSRAEYMGIHRKLIDLFKSDRTPNKQPLLMRVYNHDNRNKTIVPILELKVVYQSGLEGQFVSDYGEIISLDFTEYDQFIIEEKDNAEEFVQSPTNASGIIALLYTGEVDNMNGGPTPSSDTTSIYSIVTSNEGDVYVGGDIESRNHIALYNGATWEDIGGGMVDPVQAVMEYEDYIFFAGDSGDIKYYSKEDETLSTPTSIPNDTIRALAWRNDTIFVAGDFTTPFAYLATYDLDADTWGELDSDHPNGIIRCLLLSKDRTKLFLAGDFTQIGATSHNRIAYYDFEDEEFVVMGSGLGTSSEYVSDIIETWDGSIYACGDFSTTGDTSVRFVAKYSWQTGEWLPLTGQSFWETYSTHVSDLSSMAVTNEGVIYMAGHSSSSIARSLIFKYVGNGFISPTHISVSGLTVPIGYACLSPASDGGIYAGKG